MTIYNTLKEIYFCLDYGDRQLFDRFNLTVARYYLLRHIRETPGISFTQLSIRMISDKSNITRLVQAVEADGLVRRKRHETDRRAWSLYLTDAGNVVLDEAMEAHVAFTRERFETIIHSEEGLLDGLIKVKRVLENQLDFTNEA